MSNLFQSLLTAILKDTAAETEDVARQTNVLPNQFELYCAHRVNCMRNASYLEVTWRHPSQAFSTSDYVISVREHNSSGSILFPRNSVFPPTARNVTVLVALDVGLTYDLHITRRTNQPRWDYTTVTGRSLGCFGILFRSSLISVACSVMLSRTSHKMKNHFYASKNVT